MLRNYIVTALRSLKRNKVYTLLNVFGLALGIGCALVIYKEAMYQLSFDKHHENYQTIYRIVHQNIYPDRVTKDMGTPHPLANAILNDYPEIEKVVRTHYEYGTQLNTYNSDGTYHKFLLEDGVAFTGPAFFDVFTVPWIAGDRQNALKQPNTVVIAASEAQKLFALAPGREEEAIGKLINYNNQKDFKVIGIIEDPKETTSLPFTFLFEYSGQEDGLNPYYYKGEEWKSTSSNTNTYFIPKEGFSPDEFNTRLLSFVEKYRGEGKSEQVRYLAQPFSEVHFDEEYGAYVESSSTQFLWILTVIGLFLVVAACINFVNLATAQASERAKEIGIRKTVGGLSGQLVVQYLTEIALITFFAVLLSLAIAEVMFTSIEDILGHKLTIGLLDSPATMIFLFLLFIVVSLLSGFYPAVILSRMNATAALNARSAATYSGGLALRKGLVVLQFSISQFLIIGILVVTSQTDYFLSSDLGFDTNAIITSYLPENNREKAERFRSEMLRSSTIDEVAFSLSEPTGGSNSFSTFNYAPLGSETDYHANFKVADPYYTSLFDIKLLAGRTVQEGDSNNIVINRKVANLMGFKDRYEEVLGEKLETGWGGEKKVVGVVENFHTSSLKNDIDFIFLIHYPEIFYTVSFKVKSLNNVREANQHFEKVWNIIYPEYVLDYDFYDDKVAEEYEGIQKTTALVQIFALISIIIGCLGLYGLISFIAANRSKEIGVRRVLGATIFNIIFLFSKQVMGLITISFLITAPIAFFLLGKWLENFVFRISLGPEVFVMAFLISLAIALVTISHKTIITALVSPAGILKES